MALSFEEAKREAEYELRFEIGNLPHLGEGEFDEEAGEYQFPIMFTKPDLPATPDNEIQFYKQKEIGEIVITEDGKLTRTSNEKLNERIREIDEAADNGELEYR